MEDNKDKVALTDDDLDKVSGGQCFIDEDGSAYSPRGRGGNGNGQGNSGTPWELPVFG